MDINTIRKNFFANNPNVYANFVFNEKIGQFVCYTYDYTDKSGKNSFLTESMQEKIASYDFKNSEEPLFNVINLLAESAKDTKTIDMVSDFYYHCISNEKEFASAKDVCNALNEFAGNQNEYSANNTNLSQICAYLVNDGELDNRIFYMDISYVENKNGQKACKIENTFTEDEYKNCGIHSYGIKFLESVLAKDSVYNIIGESQACDVYQSESGGSLEDHYKNLGFSITTDSHGTNYAYKSIDHYSSFMPLTADDEDIKEF